MMNVGMYNSLRKLFSHIQNAQASRAWSTDVDKTKATISVLNVLYQNQYIRGYRFDARRLNTIEIMLKYKNEEPVMYKRCVSFRKKKTYLSSSQLALTRCGAQQRTLIISTSKGIISGTNAHKLNVGGKLICSIL